MQESHEIFERRVLDEPALEEGCVLLFDDLMDSVGFGDFGQVDPMGVGVYLYVKQDVCASGLAALRAPEALVFQIAADVELRYFLIIELKPFLTHLDVRIVMTRLSRTRMHQYSSQPILRVHGVRAFVPEIGFRVFVEIQLEWKLEIVVKFYTPSSEHLELESLESQDEDIGHLFYQTSLGCFGLVLLASEGC